MTNKSVDEVFIFNWSVFCHFKLKNNVSLVCESQQSAQMHQKSHWSSQMGFTNLTFPHITHEMHGSKNRRAFRIAVTELTVLSSTNLTQFPKRSMASRRHRGTESVVWELELLGKGTCRSLTHVSECTTRQWPSGERWPCSCGCAALSTITESSYSLLSEFPPLTLLPPLSFSCFP